jgi:hypothetical protein
MLQISSATSPEISVRLRQAGLQKVARFIGEEDSTYRPDGSPIAHPALQFWESAIPEADKISPSSITNSLPNSAIKELKPLPKVARRLDIIRVYHRESPRHSSSQ